MQIERDTLVPAPPGRVFALVDDLAVYPSWMSLVHDVDEEPPTGDRRTWSVELQAQVGPLARSKRLRMTRVVHEPDRRVVFERAEVDGKRHSPWILAATLHPDLSVAGSTRLTMTLTYGGNLWTGAVLQRVLDDHIERGAAALCALVADSGDAGPGR
jgi:carbon monoxide dehydrogenase subunit G